MRRSLSILVAGLCLCPAETRAQFSICNDTETEVFVALAALSDSTGSGGWTSSGWYAFEPYECGDLVAELRHRYYYLYVEETRFRTSVRFGDREIWGHSSDRPLVYGDVPFCVSPSDAFAITDHADCAADGLRAAGFREVDVGEHASFVITIGPGS